MATALVVVDANPKSQILISVCTTVQLDEAEGEYLADRFDCLFCLRPVDLFDSFDLFIWVILLAERILERARILGRRHCIRQFYSSKIYAHDGVCCFLL